MNIQLLNKIAKVGLDQLGDAYVVGEDVKNPDGIMDNVSKTLYIPLYGKAYVSRQGILLSDPKAEEIWQAEGFPLQGKAKSKWLAYYMGMRSAVFDAWLKNRMAQMPEAVVLHIGCGLDSRNLRVGAGKCWYDIDFPEVIEERKRFFNDEAGYHMLGADARDPEMLSAIPGGGTAIVVMEGISMYLQPEELSGLLQRLTKHFSRVFLLLDCYTRFAAKASKFKNPINTVGVTRVNGIDDPQILCGDTGFRFVAEHSMTPEKLVAQLPASEQRIFRTVYGGAAARGLYRMFELETADERQ